MFFDSIVAILISACCYELTVQGCLYNVQFYFIFFFVYVSEVFTSFYTYTIETTGVYTCGQLAGTNPNKSYWATKVTSNAWTGTHSVPSSRRVHETARSAYGTPK